MLIVESELVLDVGVRDVRTMFFPWICLRLRGGCGGGGGALEGRCSMGKSFHTYTLHAAISI